MSSNVLLSSVNNHRGWWLARHQRFLIPGLISFLLGVTLAAYQYYPASLSPNLIFPLWTAPVMLLSWSLVFLGGMLLSQQRHIWMGFSCSLLLLLGGGYYRLNHLQPGPQDVAIWAKGQQVRVVGEWFTASEYPKNAQIRVQSVNQQPSTGILLVRYKTSKQVLPVPGSLVSIDGRLSLPDDSTIPGAFNERRYLASQRITAVLHHQTQLETLQTEPVSWEGYLFQHLAELRHRITLTFQDALPSPLSEITGGIVLGDQAIPVEKSVREEFTRTGLVHLLAASGMNVAIVAGFLFGFARICRLPRMVQMLLAMLGVLAYALLSGLSPSILRATSMLEIALLLKLVDKTLTHISVLLLAVVALVLWNPELVTNVGFQLSVMTTFGIIAMVPPLQQWLGYWISEKWAGIVLLPVIAQLWAAPLLITYFNQLPLLGILLNIIVLPIITILTGLGFVVALLSLLWQPLGFWLAKLAWPFAASLYWLVSSTQGWDWAQWRLPSLSPSELFIGYGLLLLWAYLLAFPNKWQTLLKILQQYSSTKNGWFRPKRILSLIFLILSVVLFFVQHNRSLATIDVLPLNYRNTAFLLNSDISTKTLLIPETVTPWYSRKISDFLRHQGINQVDHLIRIPSLGRSSSGEVKSAILDQLETVTDVVSVHILKEQTINVEALKNQNRNSFQVISPLLSYSQNTSLPKNVIVAPQWTIAYGNDFCLTGLLQNADFFNTVVITNVSKEKQPCAIQYWQISNREQSIKPGTLQYWHPKILPTNRYFQIKQGFNGQWQIIY